METIDRDLAAIDDVMRAFFTAFTTVNHNAPNIDVLYELFLPSATIVCAVADAVTTYGVGDFVEPRRALLTGGSFESFEEHETSAKTDVFGNIGQRFSRYEKSWRGSGRDQRGSGTKSIQFVRTPAGWKIAALAWDDE